METLFLSYLFPGNQSSLIVSVDFTYVLRFLEIIRVFAIEDLFRSKNIIKII